MAQGVQLTETGASVHRLTRAFGDRRVLDDLDLDIASGEFVAMIGRSGTGKTVTGLRHSLLTPAGLSLA